MSRVSTLLDEAHTAVAALLPNHKRLGNPYRVEENPSTYLDQGYGIAVQPGAVNSNRTLSCQLSIVRRLTITITRKYFGNDADATRKYSTEKSLLEDQFLIIKDFEKRSPFQTYSIRSEFESDNGIEFVYAENKPFYMIQSSFIIEYFENLNT